MGEKGYRERHIGAHLERVVDQKLGRVFASHHWFHQVSAALARVMLLGPCAAFGFPARMR